MNLSNEFEKFCSDIQISDYERNKWETRIQRITKRLNKTYYDNDSLDENMLIVGSIGRNTSIHQVSDWDCIFDLPNSVYRKFDKYDCNGQSHLLQEIKKEILKTYSSTDIKGDGQVVVISFTDGVLELVPGFKQNDESYKYPNSKNGGSWKTTKPIPEQDEANNLAQNTDNFYLHLCRILRKWKNKIGFSFKGLLIDTLVKNFIDDNSNIDLSFDNFKNIIISLFEHLSKEKSECAYWFALGSNQHITNDDNGTFVNKAADAYELLKESSDMIESFRELFCKDFAKDLKIENYRSVNEEFPEEKFSIDIRYDLQLDCTVQQNGFREHKLSSFLRKNLKLKINKSLTFKISYHNIPKDIFAKIKWYWKVKNTGEEAIRRNCERGKIFNGNNMLSETTNFNGNHYVECFAVIKDVLIAKAHIDVPISTSIGSDEP